MDQQKEELLSHQKTMDKSNHDFANKLKAKEAEKKRIAH